MPRSTKGSPRRLTVLRRSNPKRSRSSATDRVARVRPYTEAQYEKHFAAALAELWIFSYHTAERFYMGIPDRYCAGGRWIEFKQIKWVGNRPISPIRQFSASQIQTLDKFSEAKDRCWVALLFQTPEGDRRSLFMPWFLFRHMKPQWDVEEVVSKSMPYTRGKQPLLDQILRSGFND